MISQEIISCRFNFYSFPGYELLMSRIKLLISRMTFFDINNLILDVNNFILDINNWVLDVNNLILDLKKNVIVDIVTLISLLQSLRRG